MDSADPSGFPWLALPIGAASAALLHGARIASRRLLAEAPIAPPPDGGGLDRRDALGLVVLLVVALGLRLWGVAEVPIDADEPVTLTIGGLDGWAAADDARIHPPLSALLVHWVTRGQLDFAAARLLSVAIGVATVLVVYVGSRRTGRWSALVAAALVTLAPSAIHLSRLARGYALLALLVTLAHVLLWSAVRRPTNLRWLLYSLAVALALSAEYLAAAPLLVDAMVAIWAARRQLGRAIDVGASLSAGALGVGFLGYAEHLLRATVI